MLLKLNLRLLLYGWVTGPGDLLLRIVAVCVRVAGRVVGTARKGHKERLGAVVQIASDVEGTFHADKEIHIKGPGARCGVISAGHLTAACVGVIRPLRMSHDELVIPRRLSCLEF